MDNTTRALAALNRNADKPLVVTLQAEDEREYTRLSTALAVYATANAVSQQKEQPQAVAQEPLVPQDQQVSAANGIVLNKANVVVFDNNSSDLAKLAGADGAALNANNTKAGAPQNMSQIQNTTASRLQQQQLMVQNNGFYNDTLTRNLTALPKDIQQVAASGGPYRVMLTAGQVEELTRAFRVTLLARGDAAYQFRTVGDHVPKGWEANDRENLLKNAGAVPSQDASGQTQPQAQPPRNGTLIDSVIVMEAPAANQR